MLQHTSIKIKTKCVRFMTKSMHFEFCIDRYHLRCPRVYNPLCSLIQKPRVYDSGMQSRLFYKSQTFTVNFTPLQGNCKRRWVDTIEKKMCRARFNFLRLSKTINMQWIILTYFLNIYVYTYITLIKKKLAW